MKIIQVNLKSGQILQFLNAELDMEGVIKEVVVIRINGGLLHIPNEIIDRVYEQDISDMNTMRN